MLLAFAGVGVGRLCAFCCCGVARALVLRYWCLDSVLLIAVVGVVVLLVVAAVGVGGGGCGRLGLLFCLVTLRCRRHMFHVRAFGVSTHQCIHRVHRAHTHHVLFDECCAHASRTVACMLRTRIAYCRLMMCPPAKKRDCFYQY